MAQYEKFEEWMIGRRVRHQSDMDDLGVIVRLEEDERYVTVDYEQDGRQPALVSYLVFENDPGVQEITINGQRYKLIKIVD